MFTNTLLPFPQLIWLFILTTNTNNLNDVPIKQNKLKRSKKVSQQLLLINVSLHYVTKGKTNQWMLWRKLSLCHLRNTCFCSLQNKNLQPENMHRFGHVTFQNKIIYYRKINLKLPSMHPVVLDDGALRQLGAVHAVLWPPSSPGHQDHPLSQMSSWWAADRLNRPAEQPWLKQVNVHLASARIQINERFTAALRTAFSLRPWAVLLRSQGWSDKLPTFTSFE